MLFKQGIKYKGKHDTQNTSKKLEVILTYLINYRLISAIKD